MSEPGARPRRGRPRLDTAGSTHVSVRLGNSTYDELYAYAREHGLNVAVVIRQAIEQRMVSERRAEDRQTAP